MQSRTLEQWLAHIERVHPQAIAMGLERVSAVRDTMRLAPGFPVITVGGTNGKGSACAMLDAILGQAGYRSGCYTSPHLVRYNERVRIGGREAGDDALCRAFDAVEAARQATAGSPPLTYFEFGTLAAVWLFVEARVDVAVLEVGLGGRLDAVNAFDPDCALVMSVDLDHMEYLGDTREKIGWEKAHIYRAGRPAICADADPPQTLLDYAARTGATLLRIGTDFGYDADRTQWRYRGPGGARHGLPYPALRGAVQLVNASACIAALDALRERLPVSINDVRAGLLHAENPGRFQVLPGRPLVILDVAHNPHAARALAQNLVALPSGGVVHAVFAMLKDKDLRGVIDAVRGRIDRWHVAGTPGPRGAGVEEIVRVLIAAGVDAAAIETGDDIAGAYRNACKQAAGDDKILVFGSFLTVSAALAARSATQRG